MSQITLRHLSVKKVRERSKKKSFFLIEIIIVYTMNLYVMKLMKSLTTCKWVKMQCDYNLISDTIKFVIKKNIPLKTVNIKQK